MSVSWVTTLVVLALFTALLVVGLWAVRRQNRQFPDGFDRTGWNPERDRAGWFRTKFTWLWRPRLAVSGRATTTPVLAG